MAGQFMKTKAPSFDSRGTDKLEARGFRGGSFLMSHIMSTVEWFVGQECDSFIQASEIILSHHIGYSKICQRSYLPLPKWFL